VLLGVSQRYDSAAQRWNGGFFYSLSTDLINWTPSKYFMHAQLPWTHRCGEPDPVRDPSLIDPTSTSWSFETIGRRPYLYFTRFNMEYWDPNTCWTTLDRDLIRIPVEFTDPNPNQPPTASFTASPNPAVAGDVVSFNGSASSDPDGTITEYRWDLDGNGTFETNTGTTASVTRSYADAGTVTVHLRVTDNDGGTAETTHNLTVDPPPPVNELPTAAFVVSPNPAQTSEVVTLNGSKSNDPDGRIANYRWDLDGNGSFETDTGTTHTVTRSYPDPGTVDVRLRVTDNDGAASDTTRRLTVSTPPAPSPPPAPVPGPTAPLAPSTASSAPSAACVTARTKRTQLTRKLRSARRKLARARTASARKKYRRLVRKLTRQRKRIQPTGCATSNK
jgi:PKD repeat protein